MNSGDWSQFGGHPAPGDLWSIQREINYINQARTNTQNLLNFCHGIQNQGSNLIWHGLSADKFKEEMASILPELNKILDSHGQLSDALRRYHDQLETLQARASGQLSQTVNAQHAVNAAYNVMVAARTALNNAKSLAIHDHTVNVPHFDYLLRMANQRYQQAIDTINRAKTEIENIRCDAQALRRRAGDGIHQAAEFNVSGHSWLNNALIGASLAGQHVIKAERNLASKNVSKAKIATKKTLKAKQKLAGRIHSEAKIAGQKIAIAEQKATSKIRHEADVVVQKLTAAEVKFISDRPTLNEFLTDPSSVTFGLSFGNLEKTEAGIANWQRNLGDSIIRSSVQNSFIRCLPLDLRIQIIAVGVGITVGVGINTVADLTQGSIQLMDYGSHIGKWIALKNLGLNTSAADLTNQTDIWINNGAKATPYTIAAGMLIRMTQKLIGHRSTEQFASDNVNFDVATIEEGLHLSGLMTVNNAMRPVSSANGGSVGQVEDDVMNKVKQIVVEHAPAIEKNVIDFSTPLVTGSIHATNNAIEKIQTTFNADSSAQKELVNTGLTFSNNAFSISGW
jgi:uncharacterized protein YukE